MHTVVPSILQPPRLSMVTRIGGQADSDQGSRKDVYTVLTPVKPREIRRRFGPRQPASASSLPEPCRRARRGLAAPAGAAPRRRPDGSIVVWSRPLREAS